MNIFTFVFSMHTLSANDASERLSGPSKSSGLYDNSMTDSLLSERQRESAPLRRTISFKTAKSGILFFSSYLKRRNRSCIFSMSAWLALSASQPESESQLLHRCHSAKS